MNGFFNCWVVMDDNISIDIFKSFGKQGSVLKVKLGALLRSVCIGK